MAGITILTGCTVDKVEQHGKTFAAHLSNGSSIASQIQSIFKTNAIAARGSMSGSYTLALTNVPAIMASWYKGDGYVQVFAQDDVYVYRRG